MTSAFQPYLVVDGVQHDARHCDSATLRRFADTASASALYAFCRWNDSNGDYETLTVDDLRAVVRAWANQEG